MKKNDVTSPVVLKRGVYKLNSERNFDYQLNRVINWDGGRLEDAQNHCNVGNGKLALDTFFKWIVSVNEKTNGEHK
ncbi:MAG: hypothetical protein IJ737_03785 [Ruminococcus sp.]|nr:hypothetical protein [Ruminococcus sp.]